MEQEPQKAENQQTNTYNPRKVFRCLDCNFIPLLNLNEHEKSIIIDCPNGHHNKLNLSKYMIQGFNNSLDRVICNKCSTMHKPKQIFKYCYDCNAIFCNNCLNIHEKSHIFISVRKMDTFCIIHKIKYSFHCTDCDMNICDKCLEQHSKHNLINFKKISINDNKINNMREFIEKRDEILNEMTKIFVKNISILQNKFNILIKEQKDI